MYGFRWTVSREKAYTSDDLTCATLSLRPIVYNGLSRKWKSDRTGRLQACCNNLAATNASSRKRSFGGPSAPAQLVSLRDGRYSLNFPTQLVKEVEHECEMQIPLLLVGAAARNAMIRLPSGATSKAGGRESANRSSGEELPAETWRR